MQERMLRLTSGADRLVPDDCLQYCDMRLIKKAFTHTTFTSQQISHQQAERNQILAVEVLGQLTQTKTGSY